MNVVYIHDLIKKLRQEDEYSSYNLSSEIEDKFNKKGEDVRFTAVVGNPPYQINTDTNFSTPVYHLFIEAAKSLQPDYVSLIHPARFLFNAGATPKDWNEQMLNDTHLKVPFYDADSSKVFSGVDIKGGVAITLWDKNNTDGGLGGVFVPYKELSHILEKVDGGFDEIVYPQSKTKTGLDKKFPTERRLRPNYFDKFPEIFTVEKSENRSAKIYGLEKGNKRAVRYADSNIMDDPIIETWRVLVPKSNGSGEFGESLSMPMLAEPLSGCTGSFIQIGSFDSEIRAQSCMKYIKTKFLRSLLGSLKVTQDNPTSVWKNIPLQDFSNNSDIDWSKSIDDIDKQLYQKYDLTKEEVDFIETHVKAME